MVIGLSSLASNCALLRAENSTLAGAAQGAVTLAGAVGPDQWPQHMLHAEADKHLCSNVNANVNAKVSPNLARRVHYGVQQGVMQTVKLTVEQLGRTSGYSM